MSNKAILWIGSSLLAIALLAGCGKNHTAKIYDEIANLYHEHTLRVQEDRELWTYVWRCEATSKQEWRDLATIDDQIAQHLIGLEKRVRFAERDLSVHLDMIRELNELIQEMEKRIQALEAGKP